MKSEDQNSVKIFVSEVKVPEYTITSEPDYLSIGKKVDDEIVRNLPAGKYVIRAIGKDDHPSLSLDELVSIILNTGTDKYDPNRKGVCHEDFSPYDCDIQAGAFEIVNSKIVADDLEEVKSLFGQIVYDFYNKALHDRGYSVRIDILMVYDASQLYPANKIDNNRDGVMPKLEKYLYKFKGKANKKSALLGIVKILR